MLPLYIIPTRLHLPSAYIRGVKISKNESTVMEMVESSMPLSAAVVAAPIWKLCPAYALASYLRLVRVALTCLMNNMLNEYVTR